MPTFDADTAPHGVKRNPQDYNQRNNDEQKTRNVLGDKFPRTKPMPAQA